MLPHTLDMLLQIAFLIFRRLCIHILLIRHERHLRVDDGILPLRIVQDHVRLHLLTCLIVLQRAPHLVSQPGLHLIVDALRQSLRRQQVAEDDLAHIARYLIVAPEHVRQPLGLLTQLLCLFHHQADLFAERGRVCRTLLLRLADGLLHVRDGVLQRLGDARHRLRVRLLQLRCTALQHLLRHRHKLRVALLLFLLLLVADMLQVLAHQLQFPRLRLCLGVQVLVLRLQMPHPTRRLCQLFTLHREFDILLAALDAQHVHLAVHQQIEHHRPDCHTYYYI